MEKITNSDKASAIREYVKKRSSGIPFDTEGIDFQTLLCVYSYFRVSMSKLLKYPVTNSSAQLIAKYYLMCKEDHVATVFLLDRRNKVRYISDFAMSYRAKLCDFVDEIRLLCENNRSKKCIVIYNYDGKDTFYNEISDIDQLFNSLADVGITLMDAIKVVNGKATSIISPFKK